MEFFCHGDFAVLRFKKHLCNSCHPLKAVGCHTWVWGSIYVHIGARGSWALLLSSGWQNDFIMEPSMGSISCSIWLRCELLKRKLKKNFNVVKKFSGKEKAMKYSFWKNFSEKWLMFGVVFIIFIAIALGQTSASVKPRLTKWQGREASH